MAILVRILLWLAWLTVVGWCWHAGKIGTGTAIAVGALSLVVFAWPGMVARRRDRALHYIEMGKEPTGFY